MYLRKRVAKAPTGATLVNGKIVSKSSSPFSHARLSRSVIKVNYAKTIANGNNTRRMGTSELRAKSDKFRNAALGVWRGQSVRHAAEHNGIPRRTARNYFQRGKTKNECNLNQEEVPTIELFDEWIKDCVPTSKAGKPTILSPETEVYLAKTIAKFCHRGFAMGIEDVQGLVVQLAKKQGRTFKTASGLPSSGWWSGFLERQKSVITEAKLRIVDEQYVGVHVCLRNAPHDLIHSLDHGTLPLHVSTTGKCSHRQRFGTSRTTLFCLTAFSNKTPSSSTNLVAATTTMRRKSTHSSNPEEVSRQQAAEIDHARQKRSQKATSTLPCTVGSVWADGLTHRHSSTRRSVSAPASSLTSQRTRRASCTHSRLKRGSTPWYSVCACPRCLRVRA